MCDDDQTCRCGFEFCWLCKKDWRKSGCGHTCNKPQDVLDLGKNADQAKKHLKRFEVCVDRSLKFSRPTCVCKKTSSIYEKKKPYGSDFSKRCTIQM